MSVKRSWDQGQIEAVLALSWLRGAAPALLADAGHRSRVQVLAHGELLHARGDRGDGLYTVVDGAVRFSRATVDGKSSMISLLEPVEWFGELSTFDGHPRSHDAHAVGVTVLLHHSEADLRDLFERFPELNGRFIRLLSHRMRVMYDWVEEVSVMPLGVRLARRILSLAIAPVSLSPQIAHPVRREVPLTHDELGQLLGCTRQSIAKQLAAWQRSGVIALRYGRVVIVDAKALELLAQLPSDR